MLKYLNELFYFQNPCEVVTISFSANKPAPNKNRGGKRSE